MTNNITHRMPEAYAAIERATREHGFNMASDVLTCSLLRTLATAKPGGRFLELGTGTGLSTAWILDGMDRHATLLSIDHDVALLAIAREFLGRDERLTLLLTDGEAWLQANRGQKFDYIFADTWPGKYQLLDEALDMLNPGGLYLVDDMLPQPNWPEGHDKKALQLIAYLESKTDLVLTRQDWATGTIIAVKK